MSFCLCFSFLSGAQAKENCPKNDSPESVALKFQLYSAYQTGFDGYEAPCEIKCMGNMNCQNRCQSEKALDFLAKQLNDIKNKKSLKGCSTLTQVCLEQCEKLGNSCVQVCEGKDQRGLTSTQTF